MRYMLHLSQWLQLSLVVSAIAALSATLSYAEGSAARDQLSQFRDQNSQWNVATPPFSQGVERLIKWRSFERFTMSMSVEPHKPLTLSIALKSSADQVQYALACGGDKLLEGEVTSKSLTLSVDYTAKTGSLDCEIRFTNQSGDSRWLNIESIHIAYAKAGCEWGELFISDRDGLKTRGNGDHVLSPFELMQLRLTIKSPHDDPQWAQGDTVKVTFADTPQLAALSGGELTPDPDHPSQLNYTLIVTPKLFKDAARATELDLPLQLSCATPATKVFSIPYQHSLGDTLELQRKASATHPFDFKSPTEIDSFLARYPSSEHAGVMFNLRARLLKALGEEASTPERLVSAINAYHEFIKRYADRLGAQIAVHEVYGLYQRVDSLNGYIDFLHRYPESVDATLADQRIKEMTFKQLREADEVEGYDFYLSVYPHAEPYATLAEQRALELSRGAEDAFIKSLPSKDDQAQYLLRRAKMQDRAALILNQWLQKTKSTVESTNARVTQAQIKRAEHLIEAYYGETPYYQNLMLSKQITKVLKAIEKLSVQVTAQQAAITRVIESQFAQLRGELSEQFGETKRALTQIEASLKTQEDRDRQLKALVDTYYQRLARDAGEIKDELKSAQRLEMLSTALEVGVSAYDLYQSSQRGPDKHFHFNPEVRVQFNQRREGPSATARLLTNGACAGVGGWVAGLSILSGPFAPLVGGAASLGCKWGIGKLMR